MNKEQARERIKDLVARFALQLEDYKKGLYNETQTRIDYINPMFEALGWDIDNKTSKLETQRDVIHEDKIKVGSQVKAPDYCFTVNGLRKFFLEAKKPSIDIKEDIQPAFQVRRYGWSTKLEVSIVTDFEEFAIYDCRIMPNAKDSAAMARMKYLKFTDYEKEFDFLWNLFSKEQVFSGSIERYAEAQKEYKGTDDVDTAFLKSLNEWRDYLAKAIVTANKRLDEEDVNFALQQVLDRIVFLRICEDRGIEEYGKLESCVKSGNIYQNLLNFFVEANEKYNSGLFDFEKDQISKTLTIENKVLHNIITEFYPPKSPYAFRVIPVEILGNAYEQFLGKTIKLTTGHRIQIEEKPEVRKAGGVYYTPQYIVDYMIRNTLGKLIAGKTPKEVAQVKICDPACGSGSFLLGAYQYLLDWHLDYYHAQKKKDKILLTPDGKLTSLVKKQILLNNIFGVDIDTNAVEVTKLSLLLKAVEGETSATIRTANQIFNQRVLPSLDENIKSGNSLIDMDFYDSQIDFTPQQEKKIKPFNWQQKFPQVFKKGGAFDMIIGNPPYVNIENLDEVSKTYYFQKYKTCKGRTDIYIAFIEHNLKNIRKNGIISYIIPYAFTNQNYGSLLRELLIKKFFISEIVDTSNFLIFSSANVRNIILSLQKTDNQQNTRILRAKTKEDFINQNFDFHKVNQEDFLSLKDFRLETKPVHHLLNIKEKLWKNAIPLDNICLVAYGARLNHKTKQIGKEAYIHEKAKTGFKPFLEGKNIERYIFSQHGWLDYQPNEHYNPMFAELFENDKIMFINVVKDRLRFAYDDKHFYNSHTVINCVRIDKLINATHISARKAVKNANLELCKQYSYQFLLGLLNANLINWYFKNFLSESLHFYPNDAKNLPIKKIDFTNKQEKNIHDKIVSYVDQILSLHEQMKTLYSEMKKEPLKDRIAYIESQIDNLVCELYGLDEAEREMILE